MKTILVSLLLILLLTQCEHRSNRILFDFNYEDSVINYKIYHDSLVLTFPNKTKHDKWNFETYIFIPQKDTIEKVIAHPHSDYYVINGNKIIIPLNINDTINLDHLKFDLFGQPGDGMHFTKDYNYSIEFVKHKGLYQMEANNKYFQPDSLVQTLKCGAYTHNRQWYVIPDSLFTGKDSDYYRLKFVEFSRDSFAQGNMPYLKSYDVEEKN